MTRRIVVAVLAAALTGLGGCNKVDKPTAAQLDALSRVADESALIVRATPTGEREQFFGASPKTLSTLAVRDVLRGDPRETVKLQQAGTERDPASVPDEEPLVDSDHTYWAFLVPTSDSRVFTLSDLALYRVAGSDAVLATRSSVLPKRLAAEELVAAVKGTYAVSRLVNAMYGHHVWHVTEDDRLPSR